MIKWCITNITNKTIFQNHNSAKISYKRALRILAETYIPQINYYRTETLTLYHKIETLRMDTKHKIQFRYRQKHNYNKNL